MHLKKLEIQGFKSFPEYTLIEFDKGMTAVVGPNGSGKSNVTDAIRWVLGEQSVRSLRGGKMEDVIFNGTQSRKQMNYAEVSMILDNSDRFIDSDYNEIQITRRLYRSGESEYQFNHSNCRLKDIVGLFLDTGLGKDGYSIVGQGRVDEILSTKSEDRRRVLEEASGIVKYKVRKEEAERKLKSTSDNLVRIDDILNELQTRIDPLKEDASKAIKYHQLYDEMRAKDISILCSKISKATEAMGEGATNKANLEQDLAFYEKKYVEIRDSNSQLRLKAEALEKSIENARQELSDITEDYHECTSEQKISQERKSALEASIEASKVEEVKIGSEIERLEADYSAKIKEADDLLATANEEKRNLSKLNDQKEAILSDFELSSQEEDGLRKQISDKTNRLIDSREQQKVYIERIHSLAERIDMENVSILASKDALAEIEESMLTSENLWHEMMLKESEVSSDIEIRNDKVKELSKSLFEIKKELEDNSSSLLACNARLKALSDLEKRKEGYQESVKNLLAYSSTNNSVSSKIVGVLGDLVSSKSQYVVAIEIALGSSIHNVVTNTESDAAKLISILKENRLGRITFLPIENIKSRNLEKDVISKASLHSGYIGIASDLVERDSKLDSIVSNLLGRVIICDDIDSARQIAADLNHSVKVISLEGDCINPGGSLTGGTTRKGTSGILGRAHEIEELISKQKSLNSGLSIIEKKKTTVENDMEAISKEISILNEQMNCFTLERVKAETENSNFKRRIIEINNTIKVSQSRIEAISKEKLQLTNDSEELTLVIEEIENELADFKDSIEESGSKSKDFTSKLERVKEQINESSLKLERIIAQRNGVLDISSVFDREKASHLDNLKKHEQERLSAELSCKEIDKTISSLRDSITKLSNESNAKKEEIAKLNDSKSGVDEELSHFISRLTECGDTVNSINSRLNSLVAKYDRYIDDIDSSKSRLWEEYEVTYDNVKDQYPSPDDIPAWSKRISALRAEIREIGPVNPNAVEEYKEVSTRFEFMTGQRNDVTNAIADLDKVIAELVNEMKHQFISHFEIINENFKQVFFDLFNGGTAEIILESEDVLNCAIEIKAQPPGKKLQNLSLLSGGERCLTAIALLFAILQLRPSPFVVLDEVEAALDDVNVSRFTDFVRRYTTKSQFILVTHRKGTMEACDRIYGVTMQERGISKILSMRLGEG